MESGQCKWIHIWDDKWLPTLTTHKVITPPNNLLTFPMVSSLINPAIKWWRADVISATFLPFDANTILRIPLSQSLLKDKLIWMATVEVSSLWRVLTILPIVWLKEKMMLVAPRGILSSPFGRDCGTSTFLQRLRSLLRGPVLIGYLQGKNCVPETLKQPKIAQPVTRSWNSFIMFCYTMSLLSGFGVFGLMVCSWSKETIGLFLIQPCTFLHTNPIMF